ncbi:arylsulfatase [Nocardioides sp. JQ2195]|uniref:arylsulfatase n=1 Tax=Nocardioides sp. JQ2195 TaxID=2592334 RepID=UPI00143EEFBF|nr:arylsulfatase [Nocardioides sp. JQ2195]QIX26558.1 arylsulfatase [Nocardioides sp. JQ2195]
MTRPNVVMIVLDDTGFAQLGCFGSDISTPNIDRLAGDGLRYNRFHVTALCSPTRASLLTGRNHHRVGMGYLTDIPTPDPGYTCAIPPAAGTLPAVLKQAGYSTFAAGKWHLAPRWEVNPAGPYDRWPLGLGFERYYGFLSAETSQRTPTLVRDNSYVPQPRTPDEGYHLMEDLTDEAIGFIRDQQQNTPERPFFLYYAASAMHAPIQAPEEWVRRYEGAFDQGWDEWRDAIVTRQKELGVVPEDADATPRPPWVRPWEELSEGERRVTARSMEIFAAYLSYTDAQIGRLIDHLRETDTLDNTIVMLISDNGTSAEGGPDGSFNYHGLHRDRAANRELTFANLDEMAGDHSYMQYAWPWAWAGNTPFWLWKRFTALGGVRTPLIVHWPDGVGTPGEVRDQFCHVSDLMPTVLEAAGVPVPERLNGVEQMSLDGASILDSFLAPEVAAPRETQYFECAGSRSLYHRGWKIRTDHVGPTPLLERELIPGSHEYDEDHWALFHLDTDYAETTDLSASHPELVREMVQMWWTEAGRNQVLPLNDGYTGRPQMERPAGHRQPARMSYRPGPGAVSEFMHPVLTEGFTMTAHLEVPDEPSNGIIAAIGDWTQGLAWYLRDGHMLVSANYAGVGHRTRSAVPLAPGRQEVRLTYRLREGGGTFALHQPGEDAVELDVDGPLPVRWQIGGPGLRIGFDAGFPVDDGYAPPYAMEPGVLQRVDVESGAAGLLEPDDSDLARVHE